MKLHQILTGAANTAGDKVAVAVGSVEDHTFIVYASGCDVVILASNFTRVQILPGIYHGNQQVVCVDCCDGVGKIAASYGNRVVIFEPQSAPNIDENPLLPFSWYKTFEIKLDFKVTNLSWDREGCKLLVGGDSLELWRNGEEYGSSSDTLHIWHCVWRCRTATPVHHLCFSPDGQYFASAGKNDHLVKVWYATYRVNPVLSLSSNGLSEEAFNFVYLSHPRPITQITWRRTSKYMPSSCVPNILLTSCMDNICRIWSETMKPFTSQASHVDPQLNRHCTRHQKEHTPVHDTGEKDPIEEFLLVSSFHFHLAAIINPSTDVSLLADLVDSGERTSFFLHWLNNKELQFTLAAEALLGSPSTALEVMSESDDSSDFDMLEDQDEEEIFTMEEDESVKKPAEKVVEMTTIEKKKQKDHQKHKRKGSQSPRSPRAVLDLLWRSGGAVDAQEEGMVSYYSLIASRFGSLMREWYKGSDTLIGIHPIDGSLLVWLVDWMDALNGVSYRQAQVSFLSKIPSAFSPADASSLCGNLVLYRPHHEKINFVQNANTENNYKSPFALRLPTKTSMQSTGSLYSGLVAANTGGHPSALLLSVHHDGSLNEWQVDFGNQSLFSTILSVTHLSRHCGHRFPIQETNAHPLLPLLLSTSHYQDEVDATSSEGDSEFLFKPVNGEDSSNCNHYSELILWRAENIFQLSQTGGVSELARIDSPNPDAFKHIAWLPKVFHHPLMSIPPMISLPASAMTPCACFLASDGEGLRFYQAIVDARILMSTIATGRSRSILAMRKGADIDIDTILSIGPECMLAQWDDLIDSIVSQQSGNKPGCVLKLCMLNDSKGVLQNPLLLHVFSELSVKGNKEINDILNSDSKGHEQDVENTEHFYVVGVENDKIGTSEEATYIYMWSVTIEITPTTKLNEEPEIIEEFSYVQSSDSSMTTPSVSPLTVQQCPLTSCSLTSEKVCTQKLPLPAGVTVSIVTPSIDTLSSSATNPTCAPTYLFATTCSDSVTRFWACGSKVTDDKETFSWFESTLTSKTKNLSSSDKEAKTVSVSSSSEVIRAVSCAHNGKIALLSTTPDIVSVDYSKQVSESDVNLRTDLYIYESDSTGGDKWILEEKLPIESDSMNPGNQFFVQWMSVEDSSHILTVIMGYSLIIYGSMSTKVSELAAMNSKLPETHWTQLCVVDIRTPDMVNCFPASMTWLWNGILVIAVGNELHSYSQWLSSDQVVGGIDSWNMNMTVVNQYGLFEEDEHISPVLPQYHPKHLMDLLNFGKLRRVRAILNHLVRCVVGPEVVSCELPETGCARGRTRSISVSGTVSQQSPSDSWMKSADSKEEQRNVACVPPLPVYAQFSADNDDSGGQQNLGDSTQETDTSTIAETDYSSLFDTKNSPTPDLDMWEPDPRVKSSSNVHHISLPQSPVHYGLALARLLADHLTRKQLPGLTRTEQLELLALSDTVATTTQDLEEHPQDIERGVQFAKSAGTGVIGGVMGGPGGGGGGYATTGSIGATAGSGGDAVDECGLRFLLAMRHHTCLLRALPGLLRKQLEEKGLSSAHFVWAFHSESEEELLAMVPGMLRGEPKWSELRMQGVGWWVRSTDTLRRTIEKVAKAQFLMNQDPIDCALLYLAMKKKNVICGLYRTIRDDRMSKFFSHNFTEERWRKAALKNAYSLLGMQRFNHAAAFFLLSGALWDALHVCIGRLHDIQLAIVIARLYESEPEGGPNYNRILDEHILGNTNQKTQESKDPFLRSIACWLKKDYSQALDTLLHECDDHETDGKTSNEMAALGHPDIFNFYLFLRKHPLLRRRRFLHQDKALNAAGVVGKRNTRIKRQQTLTTEPLFDEEPLSPTEQRLFFMTARAHFNAGCPDLALLVLLELPPIKVGEEELQDKSLPKIMEKTEMSTESSHQSDLIATGTLPDFGFNSTKTVSDSSSDVDWSKPVSEKLSETKDSAEAFDWSSPVSSTLNGGGLGSNDFDWSQPVSSTLNGNDDFDWSQPVSSKLGGSESAEDFDWGAPLSSKLGGGGLEDEEDMDWGKPVSKQNIGDVHDGDINGDIEDTQDGNTDDTVDEGVEKDATHHEYRHLYIVAQQLKYAAVLKLILQELCALPASCELGGEQLRTFFKRWLTSEIDLLHKTSDYGVLAHDCHRTSSETEINVTDKNIETDDNTGLNDKINIATRLEKSARHLMWLRNNQKILMNLLNYCTLHGTGGGDLAEMKMELLLLLHEIDQQWHLRSPLYTPSAGPTAPPLILATISSFSSITSPLGYLQSMTQDILKFLFEMMSPPSPSNPLPLGSVLHTLCATLSACIYQCLTGVVEEGEGAEGFGQRGRGSVGNLNQESPKLPRRKSTDRLRAISTPAKWPGVWLLRSLLIAEGKDNTTKIRVLLCEICLAVYLSLLSMAWSENHPNKLYRLVLNCFKGDMWNTVFGGGTKVAMNMPTKGGQRSPGPGARERSHSQDKAYWDNARQRWNYKLLGREGGEVKGVIYKEEFIPPEMTLMEYFMQKPRVGLEHGSTYDSDIEIDSDSDSDSEEEVDDGFSDEKTKKKSEPEEHLNPDGYSWSLMNYTICKLILHQLQSFLTEVGLDITDLPTLSPLLHSVVKILERWQQVYLVKLDSHQGPPKDFIPQSPSSRPGPALLRYKTLLDSSHTPFRSIHHSAEPAKRLWSTLVRQEHIQETFIHYVFRKEYQSAVAVPESNSSTTDETDSSVKDPVKILHKENEGINAFCINKSNPYCMVVVTHRDMQELDISSVVNPEPLKWTEEEVLDMDQNDLQRKSVSAGDQEEFLMLSNVGQYGTKTSKPSTVTLRRCVHGIKRIEAHPQLPYYITGSQDGSIRLWEFGHAQEISVHNASGSHARVTRVHFTPQGNKFGITDAAGQLTLWQVTNVGNPIPFQTLKCHNKSASDFAFVGSSSFLATSGHSSDGLNVCLWDTLLPPHSAMSHGFNCHENGAHCVAYAPCKQLLLSGGRKGNVCIFDIRKRQLRHTFQAHDSSVKCLALDESEEFFVTGSNDGDIKVWSLNVHEELCSVPRDHAKGTYFKYGTPGVGQMFVQSGGQLISCGGDGTLKLRQLSLKETIVSVRY